MNKKYLISIFLLSLSFIILLSTYASSTLLYYQGSGGNLTKFDDSTNITTNIMPADKFAISSTGQYGIVAFVSNIWTFSNYGSTQNLVAYFNNQSYILSSPCLSNDGKYQYIVVNVHGSGIRLYKSSNYGNSWFYTTLLSNPSSNKYVTSVACSASGKTVGVITTNPNNDTLTITNSYGQTWLPDIVRGKGYFDYIVCPYQGNCYQVTMNKFYINDDLTKIYTSNYYYNYITDVMNRLPNAVGLAGYGFCQIQGLDFSSDGIKSVVTLYDNCGRLVGGSWYNPENLVYNQVFYYNPYNPSQILYKNYIINNKIFFQNVGVEGCSGNNDYSNVYCINNNGDLNKSTDYQNTWTNINLSIKGGTNFGLAGQVQVTGTQPVISCINSNTYCNNTLYDNFNNPFCALNSSTYCSKGCNMNNNPVCNNQGVNTCNGIGWKQCNGTTSYQTCQPDGNGNLGWNGYTSCSVGTYCVQSYNNAVCQNISGGGTHQIYSFSVTPYAVSNSNTTYNVNTVTKTVSVQTIFTLHEQDFYTTGVNYISRICVYNESNTYYNYNFNVSNQTILTLSSAVASNNIVRISFIPGLFDVGSISLKSQISNTASEILFERNVSSKSMSIKYPNGSIIYNNLDYSLSDTLQNVTLSWTFDYTSQTYTLRMEFYRSSGNEYISTYPITFSANDIYTINLNGTNTNYKSINIVTIPIFNSYTTTTNNTLTVSPCYYTNAGVYNVRTYGNSNGQPDYSSFTDYYVNAQALGQTQNQIELSQNFNSNAQSFINGLFGSNISLAQQLFYVLLWIVVASLLMVVFGFGVGMSPTTIAVLTSIIDILILIFFAYIGFIPVWIIILLAIIASGIIAVGAKKIVTQ